mgnify:CR=1 FL=1
MTRNAVGWCEIYVQDMGRARAFYESVFDVALEKINDGTPELWKFPQSMTDYGASGALARAEGMASGGNSTVVYFSSEDCAVEGGRIVDAGGTVVRDKTSIGQYGFVVIAHDTEGNLFGIHSIE